MIVGICSKCGLKQFGYALLNPLYQICPDCGALIDVMEDDHPLILAESIRNQEYPSSHIDLVENNEA